MSIPAGTAATHTGRTVDVADITAAIEPFQRHSYAWAQPTVVNGHVDPDTWTPPTPTTGTWGRLAVVFNDRDVTFFRGVAAQIGQWGTREPFGYTTLTVEFPQITVFDTPGVGDLEWLAARDDPRWSSVELYQVDAAGTIVGTLWEGEATSYDDLDGGGIRVTCIGALYVADSLLRPPQHRPADLEHSFLIVENLRRQGGRRNLRTLEPKVEGDPSEFVTRHTGDGGTLLNDYVQRLLSEMITDAGDQWTLTVDAPRQPVLRVKDFDTTDWTVTAGAPGVEVRTSVDKSQAPNVIYGSGVDEAGVEWRSSYRLGSDVTVYRPLAEATDVAYYTTDSYGTTFEVNAGFDARAVRVERWFSFGAGINQVDGETFATRMLARDADPSYIGTITLTADPEEGHRFAITAGDNIAVQAYRGQASVLFHVLAATHDPRSMTTRLTVDSGARDAGVIEALLERRRNVMETPSRQLRPQLGSQQFNDRKQPWDVRFGHIPTAASAEADVDPRRGEGTYSTPAEQPTYYIDVAAQTWHIEPILLPDLAQVDRVEIAAYQADGTYEPTAFVCGVFAASVNVDDLPGNPFGQGAWEFTDPTTPPAWYQRAVIMWGQYGQRAGYWPGLESAGNPATGVHRDEGTWTIVLPATRIAYVVIYSDVAAKFRGRIWPSVD